MKVLGIYGSPRKGGNSDQVLDLVLEGAAKAGADIERVYVRQLDVAGCLECGACNDTGECAVKDDMQAVYDQLDQADVIVVGSPIFFYGPPSQLKALIDRSQAHWSRRMLQKSPAQRKTYDSGIGYLVAVGATKGQNLFEGTKLTAKYFFDALDMEFGDGLHFRGLEGPDAVASNPEIHRQAREFGRRIVIGK
ncbi:MAG: flavodoxin family protein [Proteobacteria bacterium]|nr:flavodoxin family protein [Pseudomonadota bacterium]MBU1741639.1 flavodoxin family protein [Pseudomonadota bacterium]